MGNEKWGKIMGGLSGIKGGSGLLPISIKMAQAKFPRRGGWLGFVQALRTFHRKWGKKNREDS